MASIGLGSDIVEVDRVEASITRYGKRFLNRIYTPLEQQYCLKHRDAGRHFAGRFAAKEAIVKALGTGFSQGISWLDFEIENAPNGKPIVTLSEKAKEAYSDPKIELTISHCRTYAMAVAICL